MPSPFEVKISKTLADAWRPHDWFQLDERVARHYYRKAAVCADVRPKRVIEIGTRCGYSLVSFATACPDARYLCIDGAADDDSLDCLAHWQSVVERWVIDASLVVVNSREVRSLPPADFAHVDGDHSYAGALHDLHLVAHVPVILADDCCNPEVRKAVEEFARAKRRRVDWINDGLREAAVIQ
jgi:predicted O-methyltransferase YrrM